MRWRVLGAGAARPNPGGACSGYLLEAGGVRVLVDCGTGVLSALLRYQRLDALDAVLISHMHPDHCADLVFLRQSLVHGPPPRRERPLPLHIGPGTTTVLDQLGAAFGDGRPYWSEVLPLHPYDPAGALRIGGLTVTFAPTEHYVPCWAMRFEADGRCLVYTADTGPSAAVEALAAGADLLVAEATLPERGDDETQWGHLSAAEAGRMAAGAEVGQLMITHYFSEFDPERLRARAAKCCGVDVLVAREGEQHVL